MIGIPRGLFYYLNGDIIIEFLKRLEIPYFISPETNKEIIDKGNLYASDEMCTSLKIYLGHVAYLDERCEYILVPRIDNYGTFNQGCTNYLALYDLVSNFFNSKILNYNINLNDSETLKKGLYQIAKKFKKSKRLINRSYLWALEKHKEINSIKIRENIRVLNSSSKKILFVSHPYNTYDKLIGLPVIDLIKKEGIEVIYSDLFDKESMRELSTNISSDLYWKLSRELIGSIEYTKDKIDGVIFLVSFPCGLDSLALELMMLKLKIPYLNIVIDDLDGINGIETRIESFTDIIKNKDCILK